MKAVVAAFNQEITNLRMELFQALILLLRKQLEHALKETEKPLSVTSTCIYNREGRMGIDRVKDDVETRLYSESDTIRNTQNRLKDALNSVHKYMMNIFRLSTSLHIPGEPADQLQPLRPPPARARPQQQGLRPQHRPQRPRLPQQLQVRSRGARAACYPRLA